MRISALLALLALACLSPAARGQADYWPQWRGPDATGVARGAAPESWSDEQNVRWQIEVPGLGASTPIIWGERIYLTTAIPTGAEEHDPALREAAEERARQGAAAGSAPGGFTPAATVEHSFEVLCLERATGKLLWSQVATVATPHEGYHKTYGSYASSSPITDGEHLYVSFGSRGVFAYDLEGEPLWSHDLGVKLKMRREFGEGHTPVIAGGALVLCLDQEEGSFLLALDRATGKELWRKQRDEPSAWATPLVTTVDGDLQLVTSATNRVRAYEAKSGALIWECGGLGVNAIPSVMRFGDDVLAMSGYREANLMSIRLGGKGDLTGSDAIRWQSAKGTAYTASPVLHDGRYYTVSDRGFVSCFDAASGEPHYLEQRLPRGSTLKASPVAAGKFLYVPTEAGDVHLVVLGDTAEIARTNTLSGQSFIASPAVAEGELFLRSLTHLFCISDRARETR